jgi:methylated-DNA-protein-cysteine methyltransferase-like protein
VDTDEVYRRIWRTVDAIPRGRVASYGQVADLAGLPRRARLVGRALKKLPDGSAVAWHRVLRSTGRSAFARGTREHREQRARLLADGVVFDGERVDLRRYGWSDPLDSLLWGPPQAQPAERDPRRLSGASRSRPLRRGR